MTKRLKRIAARCAGRVVSVSLILALLAGAAGFPVAVPVAKDHSQPFPCQDHACGCSSADECWRHCCCHSNHEKVAWARAHGVNPPQYVVEASDREHQASTPVCCHHHCQSCLAKKAQPQHEEPSQAVARQSQRGPFKAKLVVGDLAKNCRGLASVWSVLAAALPVPVGMDFRYDDTVTGRVCNPAVPRLSVELSPPVPPPKLSVRYG
jgi:hypothetical protein